LRRALAAALTVALVFPAGAAAHGIGGVKDLPVPIWLFYYGAAIVLVVSFVALGALWSRPILDRAALGHPLFGPAQRLLHADVLVLALRAASVLPFLAVWASAAFGTTHAFENLAPFVYVVFWLGMPRQRSAWGRLARAQSVALARGLVGVVRGRRAAASHIRLDRLLPAALLFAFTRGARLLLTRRGVCARGSVTIYSLATWAGAARWAATRGSGTATASASTSASSRGSRRSPSQGASSAACLSA
jgi:hypothetical protein